MNTLKLLALPALLVASVVSAEQVRLQVKFNNDTSKNIDAVMELSDELQVFTNESDTAKVGVEKDGDVYRLEVSEKNEDGEWKSVAKPEIRDMQNEAVVSMGDAEGNGLDISVEKTAE